MPFENCLLCVDSINKGDCNPFHPMPAHKKFLLAKNLNKTEARRFYLGACSGELSMKKDEILEITY